VRLLVYTRTTGYRHDSIPAGIAAMRGMDGFEADATEEFPADLSRYAVVVFLSTSGTVLDDAGREALMSYMARGGSWFGVHGASTTEYDWDWFGGLVGARFDKHPPMCQATITVEDRSHPATAHLREGWKRTDEWYQFRSDPRPDVRVLLSLGDRPLAWCHSYGGGRSFYTSLGHPVEAFSEPMFVQHLRGALDWLTARAYG
jgi:type 1 glutamine amidotransferase